MSIFASFKNFLRSGDELLFGPIEIALLSPVNIRGDAP